MQDPALWIALAAALAGAYFASCHIALKNASRTKLADRLAQRGREEEMTDYLLIRHRLLVMTGTVRACMVMLMLLAVLFYVQAHFLLDEQRSEASRLTLQYLIAFATSGLLASLFIVSIPESLGRYAAEKVVTRSLRVLRVFLVLFRPLELLLRLVDPLVKRLTGYREDDDSDSELSDEVLSVVEDHGDGTTVDETQKEMIEAVFEFRSITADEIMTPRTDIRGIEASSDLKQIKQTIQESGFSRLPVYENTIDNIVGVLYAKELIRYIKANGEEPETFELRKVMREAVMVPETKPVHELLTELKARQVHIAIVLDEYGGTAGIVTVEDIVEEIVGEIQDEHEPATKKDPEIRQVGDGVAEVDARVYVDDLNDELGVGLPEDEDYDTVGGFVFSTLGHVPQAGESFDYEDVRVTVVDVERTRINRVRVELLDTHPARRGVKMNGNGNGAAVGQ